jgi:Zn finger protein HypA/HybF involved in hydrogenase expression
LIAGDLEIRIAAVYDQLNRDLRTAEQASARSGAASGQQFGQQFGTASTTYLSQTADSIGAKFRKALQGANLAQTFANSIEAGIRSGSTEESVKAVMRSIPFVGGLVDAVAEAISEGITGAKALAAAEAARAEQEKKAVEFRTRLTKLEVERIQTVQQAEVDAAMEVYKRKGLIEKARLDIFNARAQTNERLTQNLDKQERDKIQEIQRLREQAIKDRLQRELRALDEADAKAKQIEDERKAREAKELQDKKDREIARIEEEAKARASTLREQAAAVQSSVSSFSTSFGTFKFSSYTEAEKKQVDRDILDQIKSIYAEARRLRDAVQAGGGGFN